ncbi:MAG: hypothetical protein AAFS10_07870 [Myxococcota bacterium]
MDEQIIISMELAAAGLRDSWSHCSQAANYLARYASSNHFDPERQTTVLSDILNEVLELTFELASEHPSPIQVDLGRSDTHLLIRAGLPSGQDVVAMVDHGEVGAGVRAVSEAHGAQLICSDGLMTLQLPIEQPPGDDEEDNA